MPVNEKADRDRQAQVSGSYRSRVPKLSPTYRSHSVQHEPESHRPLFPCVHRCLPLCSYMDGTYFTMPSGQAAEGLSSACWATVTPRALAMSHRRARLVAR